MRLQLITLISVFLLTSAAPAERGLDLRSSQSLDAIEKRTSATSDSIKATIGEFAGAAWQQSTATFFAVNGTVQVPNIFGAIDSGIGIWVGIDGSLGTSECDAMFSAGVACTVSQNGTSCTAQARWSPGETKHFTDIEVSAGDIMTVVFTVDPDQMSGYATIKNEKVELRGSKITSQTLQFDGSSPLCQRSAEWYVTNTGNGDLPDFSPVYFTTIEATGAQDEKFNAGGTVLYDIYENGTPATTVQVLLDGEQLGITYGVRSGITRATCPNDDHHDCW